MYFLLNIYSSFLYVFFLSSCCGALNGYIFHHDYSCVDDAFVYRKYVGSDSFENEVTSVDVNIHVVDSYGMDYGVIVNVVADGLINDEYVNDVVDFSKKNIGFVSIFSDDFYRVDYSYKVISDVGSMRQKDLLKPGGGEQWFYIDRNSIDSGSGFKNTYMAKCWSDGRCIRLSYYKNMSFSYSLSGIGVDKLKYVDNEILRKMKLILNGC